MRGKWACKAGISILTGALLAACAPLGTPRQGEALLTPQQLALSQESMNLPDQHWWQVLQDQTLKQLLDTALLHAPSLKLAQHRLDEAKALVGLSESQLGPQLDLNASFDRQRYARFGLFPPPIGGHFYNSYTLSLNAKWEFDFWGKNRAQLKAALGEVEARGFEIQQAKLVLIQAIIAQYTALQRQIMLKKINQQRLHLANKRIRWLQQRVQAGILCADSLNEARRNQAGLLSYQAQVDAALKLSRHALASLTGQNPYAFDTLTPPNIHKTPSLPHTQLSTDLLGFRPDIASQRARVESFSQRVQAARAEFYPNINLSAFIGLNAIEYSKLFNYDSRILDISPALSLPLFHSGQLKTQLKAEEARYDQAVDQYNQALLNGLKEAADAMAQHTEAITALSAAQQAHHASSQHAQTMKLRVNAGIISPLEALYAQDSALTEQGHSIDAQASALLAWVNLNTALGGGIQKGAEKQKTDAIAR